MLAEYPKPRKPLRSHKARSVSPHPITSPSLLPVEIEEVISDQIAGNECNKLPTQHYGFTGNNPMLMSTRGSGKAHLGMKVNLGGLQETSVPDKLLVGVREVSERDKPEKDQCEVAVKPKPSPAITYMDFDAKAESDDTAVRYEACWGWDKNGDGNLQKNEVMGIFDKTPLTEIDPASGKTVPYLSSTTNPPRTSQTKVRDLIFIVTKDHAQYSKNKLLSVAATPKIWLNPGYAADFIEYFVKGDRNEITNEADADKVIEPVNINSTGNGLAHPLGAVWGKNCQAETFEAQFFNSSELAEKIEENYLDSFLQDVAIENKDAMDKLVSKEGDVDWITVNLNGKELVFPEVDDIGIDFDTNDLHYSLGRTEVFGTVKFKVTRKERLFGTDHYLDVELENLDISVKDTYDFAYSGQTLPRRAAVIQSSHASSHLGVENGKVFFITVFLKDDPEHVLPDIIEIDL